MKLTSRISVGVKALRQLGISQVGLYALYQLGLRTGHYQRQLSSVLTSLAAYDYRHLTLHPCLPSLPEPGTIIEVLGPRVSELYAQADEIVAGKIRLFGGPPVPLQLHRPQPLKDWTKYEFMDGRLDGQDIKLTWEPARFGWACTLAMAYHLSKKEAYLKAFWGFTGEFLATNPPYMGPYWSSAQEVAIRLVALSFALQVFAQPGLASQSQLENLTRSIAIHAGRIPPTLAYARSQNNNHLILEALGLYTASALIPGYPLAVKWHRLGWKWLHDAFRSQIDADGTYTQHSTNYHRLMLQAALWMAAVQVAAFSNEPIPPSTIQRLIVATRWLKVLVDPLSGKVPNWGNNDGAYILPLTVCPFDDYRPVVYAAAKAFLHTHLQPEGAWDDMQAWLGFSPTPASSTEELGSWRSFFSGHDLPEQPPHVMVTPKDSWAVLHATRYNSRPAHADQLHLDLWWRGLNIALDPGTYAYNSPSPWENSLRTALVHNTLTMDGHDFMSPAGRFLYLEWAQARVLSAKYSPETKSHLLRASQDGYRRLGITHTRTVSTFEDGHWEILDQVTGKTNQAHSIRLHWLLPDWEYELRDETSQPGFPWYRVQVQSPYGVISLSLGEASQSASTQVERSINLQLVRAGKPLNGSGEVPPIAGWYSPTYAEKIPALACILEITSSLPCALLSQWIFPDEG